MKMPIARLLITRKCNRNCPGCCNKDVSLMSQARHVADLGCVTDRRAVCITGGEPMMDPSRALRIVRRIRELNPTAAVYLYTALWPHSRSAVALCEAVDGIHYTLHGDATADDVEGFEAFQEWALFADGERSLRLYIDSKMQGTVTLIPHLWARVELKPWMDRCPLPDGEELLILDEEYQP